MDPKALFGAVAGRFLFTPAQVTAVASVSARLRRIDVAGPALRGVAWTPGDKVQVFLPGEGLRTYTPTWWRDGATSFLALVHGDGPGARWAASVREGDALQFFGPRKSIRVAAGAPLVVVGDETSFGVAVALASSNPVRAVFECGPTELATPAALGLDAKTVQRRDDDAHLDDLEAAVRGALSAGATPVLTGRAAAIQALKQRFKARGPALDGPTKAYWAPAKRGLD
jgi:NADPH-dependent ferric siderophore reductase